MKRLAFLVFISGALALTLVLGLRFLRIAPSPAAAMEAPPGEGRLDQADVFSGLFRSWSLSGRETASQAQEEAVFRLGMARGSRLIRLELRRRELERLIGEAQAGLDLIGAAAPAVAPGEEDNYEEALDEATGEIDVPAADEDYTADFAVNPEEEQARAQLAVLEEEYQGILADFSPETLVQEKGRLAEIAILAGGAARGIQTLLARWGQPFAVVQAGPGLATLAKDKPVLIIPTGAASKGIAGQLAAYVRAGGTVVSFAQRTGAELRSVPGRPQGFGWAETESAFTGAVEVAATHPATSSCRTARFSAAVDGFFTDLPTGAEVLLRSASSGRPVAITYPHGKGRVAATTLYTDWTAMSGPIGEAEQYVVRDLILWAAAYDGRLHPGIIEPGAKVEVVLPLVNTTQEMAKTVRVCYLTPEGAFGKPFDLDLRMSPREKQDKTIRLSTPKSPGIWHLVYALVRADGSILQYWRTARDLAVGKPAAVAAPTGLGAAVTSLTETQRAEKVMALTVSLWNYDQNPIKVTCAGPTGTVTAAIPAGGSQRLVFRVPAPGKAACKGYYEFELSGPDGLLRLAKLQMTTASGREGGK